MLLKTLRRLLFGGDPPKEIQATLEAVRQARRTPATLRPRVVNSEHEADLAAEEVRRHHARRHP